MRGARPIRASAALLALTGCSPSDRDWHGFVIGRRPGAAAAADPIDGERHVVRLDNGPGFPWQAAKARLDGDGVVMAVTLRTDCCTMWPMFDVPLSSEDVGRIAELERAVPDRFVEGTPPPPVDDDWDRHPRTISVPDMNRYAAAAMAEVVRRLGPATFVRRAAVSSFAGYAESAIEDPLTTRAVWRRAGRTVALLDANHESVCLSVVSPDVPHPPLGTACTGVRMDCPASWYPDDWPSGDAPPVAVAPPPVVSAPGAREPACRPE